MDGVTVVLPPEPWGNPDTGTIVTPEPTRSTMAAALMAFAAINALAWVAGLRVADHVLHLDLSNTLLVTVAAVTGLAVPLAVGAARALTPPVGTR